MRREEKENTAPDPREYPFFLHLTVLYMTEKKIPREGGVDMLPKEAILLAPIIYLKMRQFENLRVRGRINIL